jgi:hypothetical protein
MHHTKRDTLFINRWFIFTGIRNISSWRYILTTRLIAFFDRPVEFQTANPTLYALLCLIIGIIVAIAGLYALSGAGKFHRLPFLRTVLIAVTAIYLLRGLNIILDIILMFKHPKLNLLQFAVFSLIAFCIGIIHLTGVIQLYKHNYSERIETQ